jgi:2-oxo-4-hydroxy-4-carboxy-5-ureidoimidazoline decarboxylase
VSATLTLERLNDLATGEARAAFESCCGSRAWIERLVAGRPYPDLARLLDHAAEVWWSLGPDDWREAFAHHPRIGDVESLRRRFAGPADPALEQASVAVAGEETLAALAAGNRAYEERFGYIFIVRASGRGADEMLAALRERLKNDPTDEIRIAADQQLEITRLRLERLLGGGPG